MFTVDEVLKYQYPRLREHPLLKRPVKSMLRKLLHEDEFTRFSKQYSHLHGIDFVEQVLEYFNVTFTASNRSLENIPVSGRVIIVANHPIGSLDGLALLKLIHGVRSDVRIVANQLLDFIKPLQTFLLPVNNMGGRTEREQIRNILHSLESDEVVIVFPAGEVSRLCHNGIKDGKWNKGFLSLAARSKSPILPVRIEGRNSACFYTMSMLSKPLSTFLLVQEMFHQRGNQIAIKVGKIIPYASYGRLPINGEEKAKLIKKHVYNLHKQNPLILRTESGIARPERRSDLKRELKRSTLLGQTPDSKKIFLHRSAEPSPVIREIGRLREITFRTVGEGTGQRRDMDHFDQYYSHLVLWDEDDLEIVGAYRFVDSQATIDRKGFDGLYTSTLFNLNPSNHYFLNTGLELGRSFVQKRYWGKRSLDYLWYGIGAFLAANPRYRYLYGPVSISASLPETAKELMIYFYQLYFSPDTNVSCSKKPYRFSTPVQELALQFNGRDHKKDFKKLKFLLANMGTSVPTLYKQYSQLCKPGGVHFIDFNIDPDFNNCVDGLVVVDLQKLKKKKRQRYINSASSVDL